MPEKEIKTMHLVRSEQEIKDLKNNLIMWFTYTMIALSPDQDNQINNLKLVADYNPEALGTYCFGRMDN